MTRLFKYILSLVENRSFYKKETLVESANKSLSSMVKNSPVCSKKGLFIKDWGHEALLPTCPT